MWKENLNLLEKELSHPSAAQKCVGIGECGLDYYYEFSPKETQLEVLDYQLELAKKLDLPLIFHCREAFSDLFERVKKIGLPSKGAVMHCFTGTTPDANAAIDLGMYISFSGIVTFKNAESLRQVAKSLPRDRVVLETDCPFLSPVPMRGKPCEPSYLPYTALKIAELWETTALEVSQITTYNARQLFSVPA
jgi:TatD DNase family protein